MSYTLHNNQKKKKKKYPCIPTGAKRIGLDNKAKRVNTQNLS